MLPEAHWKKAGIRLHPSCKHTVVDCMAKIPVRGMRGKTCLRHLKLLKYRLKIVAVISITLGPTLFLDLVAI